MFELLGGVALVLAWAVLQFVVQATTGWIHLALIVGVLLIIRGIVVRDPGTGFTAR